MVIINDNDKAYYESIGMLETNMKRFEQERIRLGLPDNCTLEELNEAISITEQGKINVQIEKKHVNQKLILLEMNYKFLRL